MNEIGANVDPWIPSCLLIVAMLLGWGLGWWRGRSLRGKEGVTGGSKFGDALIGLLGLLLAFTFSMSLVKHEGRRQMSVSDSNSIGDFYTCIGLLEDPFRSQLQALVKKYVQHRIAMAKPTTDEASLQTALADIREMHTQMQNLVKAAVDRGTPVVVPLVNTFNGVTSNHAARLAAIRDRLPLSIILLLGFSAVLAVAVMGKQQSLVKESTSGATVGFILLVGLVFLIILDLNQPQRGWIRISQEPLELLLKSFE